MFSLTSFSSSRQLDKGGFLQVQLLESRTVVQ